MNGAAGFFRVTVRIRPSTMEHRSNQDMKYALDIPPRSRLYGLAPCTAGTVWGESLTSYINRLGWVHGIAPRALVAQEIVPRLGNAQTFRSEPFLLNALCRGTGGAMNMNGTGSTALEWAKILEQLTIRSDLHLLTLHWWIGELSVQGQLRTAPAWCPMCYAEWKYNEFPIYQPLLWTLKLVNRCPRHGRRLEERCPHCHKRQSIIAAKSTCPGECTQCAAWLGTGEELLPEQEQTDEIRRQEWAIHVLEELHLMSVSSGPPQWNLFFSVLTTCLEEPGGYSQLARLAGISRELFYMWTSSDTKSYHRTPSLESILRLCYACDVTPLQILRYDLIALNRGLQSAKPTRYPQLRQPVRHRRDQIDRLQCLELINAVLEGKEEPLGACQVAKRLGYNVRQLYALFPEECRLLTEHAKEYRKQHKDLWIAQKCEEIRQTVKALHAQGIFPSLRALSQRISDPAFLRAPEARTAWHAARRELGLE